MKKFLLLMLSAVLFAACSNDEKEPEIQVIDFADFSQTIGMSYADMIKTYGDPSVNFGSFYMYEETGNANVEGLVFIINTDNQKVYQVMETLKEDAYKAEDIQKYFDSKYTFYSKEEYNDEETGYTSTTYIYGNAKDIADATLVVTVSGNSSVTYTDPTNEPAIPEGPDMSELSPISAPALFMGMTEDDLKEEYGSSLMNVAPGSYMMYVENDYLEVVGVNIVDGVVKQVVLLFNESLSDEEIIDYYKEYGYMAMPYEGEEGETAYLFMNMTTGDAFTYSTGRAEINDLSDMDDDEDYDDED